MNGRVTKPQSVTKTKYFFASSTNKCITTNSSHAGIDTRYQDTISLRERVPCLAHLRDLPARSAAERLGDLGRSFEYVDRKTERTMPREMAVQRPHAWVVCVPLDNQIAGPGFGAGGHNHDIASLGVVGTDDRLLVCGTEAAVEDLHVVAV